MVQGITPLNLSCPPGLPIASCWDRLISAIAENQVIIVTGDTGCGKTTQLPKIAMLAGQGIRGKIVCTQPRRVAAMAVASRLSYELGEAGPLVVGYKIRFRDKTPRGAKIKFVTDGILLAELQGCPLLRAYDTIIVDEAHERSLNIDIILGAMRRLLEIRPDLKLIISSATMDTGQFSRAFPEAPVIEIRGRSYPIEIIYRPCPTSEDQESEPTPVEQVVSAIDEIRAMDQRGNILSFLATEREIKEAVRLIKARTGDNAIVLPMYSRLSFADQQKIFAPCAVQKIIVSTNIAETSLTVPDIRYVVDSGLARVRRYNVRSRTTAMPVVPISKASADQRAGRAGRTAPGVCIRLYDEKSYNERADYSMPEILRSNLAEVILRLVNMGIDNVADFPFIDPPCERAIKEGFNTLRELGAIGSDGGITHMGRLMARLPLDPRIARIIIQARKEKAVNEAVVIAAALSIQDPRERPADKEMIADQAHSVFKDKKSDFVSFLRIWNTIESKRKDGVTRNQLKRFCKENFLSYMRIEEWRDVYEQICSILSDVGDFHINDRPAGYDQVHRSILAGLLSQIALHKEDAVYTGVGGRKVQIFPGSGLYKRRPRWIVAAEFVKTSQLFARTVAEIKPEWIEELAGSLAQSTYFEPHWDKARGEVMAWEKVSVFGLVVVEKRRVSYSRVNPVEARKIFIAEALASCGLKGSYPFLEHNRKVIAEIKGLEDRMRRSGIVERNAVIKHLEAGLGVIEDKTGLGQICNERTLARAIRISSDSPLFLDKDALLHDIETNDVMRLFPGHIDVMGHEVELVYSFSPGDEKDGVTARIPLKILNGLPSEPFEWLVPGLLSDKISYLLHSLPKEIRRRLVPVSQTARKVIETIRISGIPKTKSLFAALEDTIKDICGVHIERSCWPRTEDIPGHLMMRFEVLNDNGQVVASGRDLSAIKNGLKETAIKGIADEPAMGVLRRQWERHGFGLEDIPETPFSIPIGDEGMGLYAYPGLVREDKLLGLRLFLDRGEAMSNTISALVDAVSDRLSKELSYLRKNCLPAGIPKDVFIYFGGEERFRDSMMHMLRMELLGGWDCIPAKKMLLSRIEELRKTLFKDAMPLIDAVGEVLMAFSEVQKRLDMLDKQPQVGSKKAFKDIKEWLSLLISINFPEDTDRSKFYSLVRQLKAVAIRAERAYADPIKDSIKSERLRPYINRLLKAKGLVKNGGHEELLDHVSRFESLVNEYRIAIFAPELKTLIPVSPKRLDDVWREIEMHLSL
ncbi:MAG: ATP-dependent RNA helicase HrpA [Dissulfurimicrobium sp.]|uniref:ATP-dependent RNA helicase HrpA n=1 Tax=Dissulfurimicrobium sp. TaxID=2022436 RepID=UPI004049FBAB